MTTYLYRSIIARDLRLAFIKVSVVIGVIGFFIIAASMFIFAVPNLEVIPIAGSAILWVCALLASLLALDGVYKNDYENGVLDQYFLQGHGVLPIVIAKIISHWCVTGLPILVTSPLLLMMFGSTMDNLAALLMGTVILSFLTNLAASITIENNHPNLVMGILILPLYIPILIFGVHHNYMLLSALILLFMPITLIVSRFALIFTLRGI